MLEPWSLQYERHTDTTCWRCRAPRLVVVTSDTVGKHIGRNDLGVTTREYAAAKEAIEYDEVECVQ
jgi:hypothetical protein